ncbi:Tubulin--tyrosine ligase-like protein 9 [Plasmodiophora brassicae]|uniref:Tubulin--tyrosine ligase-like protein 9 n=1 Tax=Plasmodiophora brassicae TaxID=37360 RepID=A0A0G4J1F3_PLABS|nr:hypothetical protein PBRA_008456 [Plasmodiophora brassicae]SPR01600.1 unnamed protein product [Plasmodiophora brassicae]
MSRRKAGRENPGGDGGAADLSPTKRATGETASMIAARELLLIPVAQSLSSSPKKAAPRAPSQIRYRTAFHTTIGDVLRARGWKETDSDLDWDIFWADATWIRDVYDHVHLETHQRVNHFRNHYELTRKDLLVKNLKRARRLLLKHGNSDEAAKYDFSPTTFNLPAEYSLFVEEFKKNPTTSWIMKPIAKSQGKGIFLFQKLSEISDWRNRHRSFSKQQDPDNGSSSNNTLVAESYVVQQYISNPYLVGGKKFDMRVYVLVTSYSPLTIYAYRSGFARFSTSRFSMSNSDLTDHHIHLTNVAIQKSAPKYDPSNGGKWSLRNLKLYMVAKCGEARANQLFNDMQLAIIRSLIAVRKVMINDKHSFELYGYDLLFDTSLKVWLLEVNAYPSLSANTPSDYKLKCDLLDDVLHVVDVENRLSGDEVQVGGFDLIYRNGLIRNDKACAIQSYLGCHNNRVEQLAAMEKQRQATKKATLAATAR